MKKIDHIAIAVRNLDMALSHYKRLGLHCKKRERVDDMGIEIAMIPVGESQLELVSPLKEDSPISHFLTNRGEGLHHICFAVGDVDGELANLVDQNVDLIDKTPRAGGEGRRIAFVHPKEFCGVLIELADYKKK